MGSLIAELSHVFKMAVGALRGRAQKYGSRDEISRCVVLISQHAYVLVPITLTYCS